MGSFVIAIDGPAGSGKSTTARLVAERLGFRHLDTGAMYRAVTVKCLEAGIELPPAGRGSRRSASATVRLRALQRMLARTRVAIEWLPSGYRVLLDGRDVSREIREPRVSEAVSAVSAIPEVRRVLVPVQRRSARGLNVVCEGRDIGSVVFPDAGLKVFLDCDIRARTRRRVRELVDAGISAGAAAVGRNLAQRDRVDADREISPLVRTPDAVLVDTTDLTIEEQVAVVCDLARRRIAS